MAKRNWKIIKSITGIIVIVLGLWIYANFEDLKYFPAIISSFTAKEMCSCLFVIEQKEPFCRRYVKQWLPVQKITIDRKKKIVKVKGLWITNEAKYINRRSGCVLVGDPLR